MAWQDAAGKGHIVHSGRRRRGYRRADSLAGAADPVRVFDAFEAGPRIVGPSRCCSNRRLKVIEVRLCVLSMLVDKVGHSVRRVVEEECDKGK